MTSGSRIISGVVRDQQGNPIAGARVAFTAGPVPLPDIAALTDSGGRFTLSAPARGRYAIQCIADGFAPASVTVEVDSAQEIQVEIELRP